MHANKQGRVLFKTCQPPSRHTQTCTCVRACTCTLLQQQACSHTHTHACYRSRLTHVCTLAALHCPHPAFSVSVCECTALNTFQRICAKKCTRTPCPRSALSCSSCCLSRSNCCRSRRASCSSSSSWACSALSSSCSVYVCVCAHKYTRCAQLRHAPLQAHCTESTSSRFPGLIWLSSCKVGQVRVHASQVGMRRGHTFENKLVNLEYKPSLVLEGTRLPATSTTKPTGVACWQTSVHVQCV